jgi:hypothetical protein
VSLADAMGGNLALLGYGSGEKNAGCLIKRFRLFA